MDFQIFSPFFIVDFMDKPDSVILDSNIQVLQKWTSRLNSVLVEDSLMDKYLLRLTARKKRKLYLAKEWKKLVQKG